MTSGVQAQVQLDDSHAFVRLTGRLDMSSAPVVRRALHKCLAEQPAGVVAGLADLAVDDPTALLVFGTAARQAAIWPGVPIVLVTASVETTELLGAAALRNLRVARDRERALDLIGEGRTMPAVRDELLPVSGAARQARDLVTGACVRWDLPELIGPATLIISELVANASQHAHTMMTVTVALRDRRLHIAVRDGSTEPPRITPEAPASTEDGGRGLRLVDEVAHHWGDLPTEGGKVVWATLRVPEPR